MLFEKMHSAWKARDFEGWKSCHHSDYTFVSHAMGKTMTRDDMPDQMMSIGSNSGAVTLRLV